LKVYKFGLWIDLLGALPPCLLLLLLPLLLVLHHGHRAQVQQQTRVVPKTTSLENFWEILQKYTGVVPIFLGL
jgi:hypothetical protein